MNESVRLYFVPTKALEKVVGKEHLAVNLSCVRRLHKGRSKFFAWPDRRQEITSFELTEQGIKLIAHHCSRIFCMNFTPVTRLRT